ncbi:MAG: HEPN domain-containing protein [Xenococcaceae cyanobacterium]
MPSPAALKYESESSKARILRETATDPRLRPMSRRQIQVYYHSALAAFVAAWDAYINELVRYFFDATADPLDPKFNAVHSIAKATAERALERFNTPNWDNTRNLLIQNTGYDPIGDWVWTARSMNGVAVRLRLNEILRVRHSFAHGFSIPAYSWTQSPTGKVRLTAKAIKDVDAFFQHLVNVTDLGMKQYIQTNYGIVVLW